MSVLTSGVLVTGILLVKNVKGGILWGILITWALGILCQFVGLYVPNPDAGFYSLLPDFSNGISVPSMAPTFMKMDFAGVFSLDFIVIMFAFLFVDMFDTLGTLIGVASKADMLDKDGKFPKIKGALLSDAVGTTVGAMCGTSTVTTFVESASGVAEGGRTGLTSLVSAILFALSLFLSPIFLAIPSFATAPALIVVGFLMLTSVTKIDFDDLTEAIPAFIAIIAMPLISVIFPRRFRATSASEQCHSSTAFPKVLHLALSLTLSSTSVPERLKTKKSVRLCMHWLLSLF